MSAEQVLKGVPVTRYSPRWKRGKNMRQVALVEKPHERTLVQLQLILLIKKTATKSGILFQRSEVCEILEGIYVCVREVE